MVARGIVVLDIPYHAERPVRLADTVNLRQSGFVCEPVKSLRALSSLSQVHYWGVDEAMAGTDEAAK